MDGPLYAAVNCDDADLAEELAEEEEWTGMTSLYMSVEEKEVAKRDLELKAFPFVIVVRKNGRVAYQGSPKNVDLATLLPQLLEETDDGDENAAAGGNKNDCADDAFALDEDF